MKPTLDILVVEDHEDTTSVLCDLLRDWGHDVRWAGTIADAKQALSLRKSDVLLADIGLPDGDGWRLLQGLGQHTPPYAIAMSGHGSAADEQRSHRAGYRHHLVKPFEADTLKGLLHDAAVRIDGETPTN